MSDINLQYENFLNEVNPAYREFVDQTNDFLSQNGCKIKIEIAKNGYVVSYNDTKRGKVVANFVFRKSGLIIRIYGDHVNKYASFLETLPNGMIKAIEKAPICKRLADPAKCNSRCQMGYIFTLNNVDYQKCRFNCFMFLVSGENNPFIKTFLENEMSLRTLAI